MISILDEEEENSTRQNINISFSTTKLKKERLTTAAKIVTNITPYMLVMLVTRLTHPENIKKRKIIMIIFKIKAAVKQAVAQKTQNDKILRT